jgi:hypothetical protein
MIKLFNRHTFFDDFWGFLTFSVLNDICRCSREHCEQTGRSIVTPGDVFMALVNSGLDVENFSEFLNSIRHSRPYQFTRWFLIYL